MEALVRSAVCYSPPAYNTQVACWFATQLWSLVLSLNVTVPASAPHASAFVSDEFSFHRFAYRPRWSQRCPETIVTGLAASRAGHTNAQSRPTREPGTRPVADARHSHKLVSEPRSDGLEKRTGKEDTLKIGAPLQCTRYTLRLL